MSYDTLAPVAPGEVYGQFDEALSEWLNKWPQSPDKIAQKLIEEVGELFAARLKNKPKHILASEYGDVLICLASLARLDEVDLQGAARDKIEIVLRRDGEMREGLFVKKSDL